MSRLLKYRLVIILGIALALRLGYVLSLDPLAPYVSNGGDTVWYLTNAYTFMTGQTAPYSALPVAVEALPIPPVYLLFIGIPQALFSPAGAILVVRILQSIMGVATCWFVYRIGMRVAGERAGLLAAVVLAISPVFINETGSILTETTYIFLVAAGLMLYIEWVASETRPMRLLALSAAIFGLATLTRAVSLLFPVGLALHLLLIAGRGQWRSGLKRAGILLAVYAAVVSTWTIYNLIAFDRLVIGSNQIAAMITVGAIGWNDPNAVDTSIQQIVNTPSDTSPDEADYLNAAAATISGDPLGYVAHRLSELTGAYLQPYGTVAYGGKSLKAAVSGWWHEDRSLGGLLALTRDDAFWPKLVIYLFHYTGLILGLIGMWLYRRQWRLALPLIGFVLYTTLAHLVFLATPRYIFPTEIVFWIFAAGTLIALWDRIRKARRPSPVELPGEPAPQA